MNNKKKKNQKKIQRIKQEQSILIQKMNEKKKV